MSQANENGKTTDVAIVGGGPVGLMLAMFLDRHGVKSVVFNREPSVRAHPKGSTHNSRTMEHYRRLGFSQRVRNVGLPPDHPTDVAYFTRFDGWELARIAMPSEAQKQKHLRHSGVLDQIPEPVHRANQMFVEPILFDEAVRSPNITLRFGWEVEVFEDAGSSVSLQARDVATGAVESWQAMYLAGCDGGRSFVRSRLGIDYEGSENLKQAFFGGRMISTHLRAPTLYRDLLGGRRAWQYWIVNPQVRTAMVALNGDDEFLLWIQTDDPDYVPDDAAIAALMKKCAGVDVPVEVLAFGKWTAGVALVAERFSAGDRIHLAGDAVHLFTPTGGFGMNTGVDDAANLAWKLAAAVQGWAGPALLASYELERKPVAVRNTAAARALAQSVGKVPVAPALDDDSPAGESARREAAALLATFGDEYASLGVQLGARYDASPVVMAHREVAADGLSDYLPTSLPGGRAPHFWIGEGRQPGDSVYDRLGVGFCLLCFDSSDAAGIEALLASACRRGIPLTVLRLTHPQAHALYAVNFALVRPDQHIAWRGDELPQQAGDLLDLVTGHGQPPLPDDRPDRPFGSKGEP